MKKTISLLLALLLASSSVSMVGATETEKPAEASITAEAALRVLGDINADESVDVKDSIALFQFSMLPDLYPVDYPGELDMDKNGDVNIGDAIRLF